METRRVQYQVKINKGSRRVSVKDETKHQLSLSTKEYPLYPYPSIITIARLAKIKKQQIKNKSKKSRRFWKI